RPDVRLGAPLEPPLERLGVLENVRRVENRDRVNRLENVERLARVVDGELADAGGLREQIVRRRVAGGGVVGLALEASGALGQGGAGALAAKRLLADLRNDLLLRGRLRLRRWLRRLLLRRWPSSRVDAAAAGAGRHLAPSGLPERRRERGV